jgi:type VI protein secretion system component VasF
MTRHDPVPLWMFAAGTVVLLTIVYAILTLTR